MAVLDEFDHRYINELPPFNAAVNPTAENLARIIFERLAVRPEVTATAAYLAALTVWETPKSSVTYERD